MSLVHYRTGLPPCLTTNASNTTIGAVLEQFNQGRWSPLEFFFHKLTDSASRYATFNRELLACFSPIEKFCHLLHGVHFSLQLDHKPVVQALTKKSESLNGHQVWQLAYIMEFDVQPFYLASQDNTVANALSWAPVSLLPSPAINTP